MNGTGQQNEVRHKLKGKSSLLQIHPESGLSRIWCCHVTGRIRVWIKLASANSCFVKINMLCRTAVVSLPSFCAWKRIKAEPPPGSRFTRDCSALLAFIQSGFFVIQWAYLRSEEEDRFEGPRYLSCDSSQRWKEDDFLWRRQPEWSSTQVSWLCYRQSAARLPKPWAVIAKKIPALVSKGVWARLLSN